MQATQNHVAGQDSTILVAVEAVSTGRFSDEQIGSAMLEVLRSLLLSFAYSAVTLDNIRVVIAITKPVATLAGQERTLIRAQHHVLHVPRENILQALLPIVWIVSLTSRSISVLQLTSLHSSVIQSIVPKLIPISGSEGEYQPNTGQSECLDCEFDVS